MRPFPLELEKHMGRSQKQRQIVFLGQEFLLQNYTGKGMSHIHLKENLKLERAMYSSIIYTG